MNDPNQIDPARIHRLTPQQEARIPAFREEWLELGRSTEPADRPGAEAAIIGFYRMLELPAPRFLWVGSPWSGRLAISALVENRGRIDELEDRLPRKIRSALRERLSGFREGSLGHPIRGYFESEIYDALEALIPDIWGIEAVTPLDREVTTWIERRIAPLRVPVEAALAREEASAGLPAHITLLWGQQDVSWIAYHRFCLDIGLRYDPEEAELVDLHEKIARSCHWYWPFERVCIVCDRPEGYRYDPHGRLHSGHHGGNHRDDAPAMVFRDGWEIWAWHGVPVPRKAVAGPATLEAVAAETNAEGRRVLIERYGWERYLADAGARVIHTDEVGELLEIRLDDRQVARLARVKDGTPGPDGVFRAYLIHVPPNSRTCREAVAATYGLAPEDFRDFVRT
ncbi:MAG: hypothetical protein V3S64_08775 [bacterium]